ncbi:MAG TPA: acetyl-CoA carboxylase biotin carboxylase subunit [Anaerolineae bacterium]|nr:acetyl-CoA carboxylase biotin carboxylase subunit [Anaerolineae bacterium]HQK14434.1 acetyl-CoA carboxylase biotin carboxylase subunit [Anaerolineae bacterium]
MKVLVANRGEIAIRILRACRDLGLPSVAVYSDADREALHTRYADEALYLGPTPAAQSYLNIPAVIAAAQHSGADAIHPGYGFLSENADFARAVEEAGLTFIGPRPETIALTGDKLAARRAARDAGLPVLPGPDAPLTEEIAADIAAHVQYPVLVKATAGGGGRGIRLARNADELAAMVTAARKEAQAAFGDDTVYLEPLVQRARHIEVQILGDGAGRILCLGERECSIQRRRQKLIEEAPAHGLRDAQRAFLYDAATRIGRALGYRSLGTVEFLLDDRGVFHFIEINPRIQVEHPVTEMVTGLDLVKEQLRLAAGKPLRYTQETIELRGAAIEARVLAEDPTTDFLPATGIITHLKEPGGPGIRVDSALYTGMTVTVDYDSLLAKVIAWGENRAVAIVRLRRALREFQIGGIATDLEFLFQIVDSPPFQAGNFDTTYLDRFAPPKTGEQTVLERDVALVAALLAHRKKAVPQSPVHGNAWRIAAWREQM